MLFLAASVISTPPGPPEHYTMLYYTKKVIIPSGRTGATHMINKIVLACIQDLLEFSQLIAKVK